MTACELAPRGSPIIFLPPPRRAPNRAAWQRARFFRGPTWSCAEWAMALVGRGAQGMVGIVNASEREGGAEK
jgi:hypothetical protein